MPQETGLSVMFYCCKFSGPSLGKIALLAVKGKIPLLESSLSLESYSEIPQKFSDALKHTHETFPDCHILVVKNDKAFVDSHFLTKMMAALENYDDNWSLVSGAGLGVNSETYIAHYAAGMPSLTYHPERRVIIDSFPDAYLLNDTALKAYLQQNRDLHHLFEPAFIHSAMKEKRLAFYDPHLSIPINGNYLCRDYEELLSEFETFASDFGCDRLQTLTGVLATKSETMTAPPGRFGISYRQDFKDFVQFSMKPVIEPMTISVVVRTIFKRTYLLHRLLASIVRALTPEVTVEVVLSTDIDTDKAAIAFEHTKRRFGNLTLKMICSAPDETPQLASRVRNLVEGAKAASNEYVWFMDDDDYIDPFSFTNLSTQLYDGVRPIFFAEAEIRSETWQELAGDKAVLSQSEHRGVWGSDGWRQLFSGVNRVPICGIIAPRERVVAAFDNVPMRYNLSEDYMMHLAVMLGENLPLIVELKSVLSYISMRGVDENTMNASDRTNWCLDIFGFLQDLRYFPCSLDRSLLRLGICNPHDTMALQSENENLKKTIKGILEKNTTLNRQLMFMSQLITETKAN